MAQEELQDRKRNLAGLLQAAHGEPWLIRFEVEELKRELIRCGFGKVSFLESSEAESRNQISRPDLPSPKKIRLCEGMVKPVTCLKNRLADT